MSWVKVSITNDAWPHGDAGDDLLLESGEELLTQDGISVSEQGYVDTWSEGADPNNPWSPEGALIYLATEGTRARLMSEGNLEYLVYSRPNSWTDTSIEATTFTKVNIE